MKYTPTNTMINNHKRKWVESNYQIAIEKRLPKTCKIWQQIDTKFLFYKYLNTSIFEQSKQFQNLFINIRIPNPKQHVIGTTS